MYSTSASTLTATLLGINMLLVCFDWLPLSRITESRPNIHNNKAYNAVTPLFGFNDTEYNEQISMLIHDGLFPIVVTASALNLSNFRVKAH